jgi:biopolymer transport protein ExbD
MAAKLAGPGGGGRYHVDANSEINVTPFVDVMLVLLIIFMVAAPLAVSKIKVELPIANAKDTPNPPKPFNIAMKPDGSTYLQDQPTTTETVGVDLKKLIGTRNPEKERIFIRADKQVLYGDFTKVMASLQDNGFYSVALVGEDKAGVGGHKP